jgi:hypothetical protein
MTTTNTTTHLREQRDTAVEQSRKQAHEYATLKARHDELLSALKNMLALANDPAGSTMTMRQVFGTFHAIEQIEGTQARAAIARAEGR